MKANQKFLNNADDQAVSPVIAVILMVAITVVLAATVYVWVSGFGSSTSNAQKSMALTSASPIDSTTYAGDFAKSYTVASATAGMKYSDFTVTVNGVTQTFDATGCAIAGNAQWGACSGATDRAATDVVQAGDVITIRADNTPSGATLRLLDTNANSVMLTLVVG